jgi:hypothetical protein
LNFNGLKNFQSEIYLIKRNKNLIIIKKHFDKSIFLIKENKWKMKWKNLRKQKIIVIIYSLKVNFINNAFLKFSIKKNSMIIWKILIQKKNC